MVDKDQLDRFEEVFKNALNNDAPVSESWASPSDDVWEDLVDKIEVRKSRNKLPFIIPIFLFFFIGGNILYNNYTDDGGTVFSAIFKSNKKIKALDESLYANTSIEDDMLDEATQKSRASAHDLWKRSSVVQSGIMLFVRDDRDDLLTDPTNFYFPFEKRTAIVSRRSSKKSFFSMMEDLPTLRAGKVSPSNSFQKLSKVYSTPDKTFLDVDLDQVNKGLPGLPVLEREEKQKKFSIKNYGISSSAFSPEQKFSSAYAAALANSNFSHSIDNKLMFGGKIEWALSNKFALETGLSYRLLKLSSSQNRSVDFDPTLEMRSIDNIPLSNFSVPLASPFGAINSDISFLRNENGSTIINPMLRPIPFNVSLAHELRELSVPMNLKFTAIENKKFSVSPIIGTTTNLVITDKNKITDLAITTDSSLPVSAEFSPFSSDLNSNSSELNPINVDLLMGFDLNVPIIGNKELEVSPFYTQGINPTFKNDSFSTTNNSVGVSFGLNFKK